MVAVFGCGAEEALLVRRLGPPLGVSPVLTAAPLTEDTVGLARGSRAVSISHRTRVSEHTLRALARIGVGYVSTRSVGSDHLDLAAAARLGLTVETVSYSPDSVADYTLLLILMVLRRARSVLRRADGYDFRLPVRPGRELRDLTVGVVGTGRIGSAVVARLRVFGCAIVSHDTGVGTGPEHRSLDELLRSSDVVTLHTPLTAATYHLLDHRRIECLKPGAVVVNTGRGGLLDTAALLAGLESGRLGGAALDVVEGETGVFGSDCRNGSLGATELDRLLQLPNVVISPHLAYYTDHALSDLVANSLAGCLAFVRSRPPERLACTPERVRP